MQILMCIEGSAVDLADADGDVGAVVGNPFKVGHNIGKDKAKLDRAFSTLEPFRCGGSSRLEFRLSITCSSGSTSFAFFYIFIIENGEGQADDYPLTALP